MSASIQQLKQQLTRTPQDPELHYELGRHYLALKQAEDAEQAFLRALQWAPDHPQILMTMVIILLGMKPIAYTALALEYCRATTPQVASLRGELIYQPNKLER